MDKIKENLIDNQAKLSDEIQSTERTLRTVTEVQYQQVWICGYNVINLIWYISISYEFINTIIIDVYSHLRILLYIG